MAKTRGSKGGDTRSDYFATEEEALHEEPDRSDDKDGEERSGEQARRPRRHGVGDVDAEHVEGAVRDVDDPHHAERQRETAGDQKEQRGGEESVKRLNDEIGQS